MSKSWREAGGTTGQWRKVRAQVLARDGGMCQIKLPGEWTTFRGQKRRCLIVANSVHHTLGRSVSGDDPAHLVAACMPCNLRIGQPGRTPSNQHPRPGRPDWHQRRPWWQNTNDPDYDPDFIVLTNWDGPMAPDPEPAIVTNW